MQYAVVDFYYTEVQIINTDNCVLSNLSTDYYLVRFKGF
jgi:hypothetical protein